MLPERLNKLFAKRGGDLFTLVFSLLLAFFMWGMHSFTQEYSTYYNYNVIVDSNIEGRAKSATSYNSLVLRGKSTGFFILQQRLSNKSGIGNLNISVDTRRFKVVQGREDFFYLLGEDIKAEILESLGNDLHLESITTDTLYFRFPKQANKKVPVVMEQKIGFAPQYMVFGGIQYRPDSVVIYGDEEIIKTVNSVHTKDIHGSDIDSPMQGVADLKPIRGVRFSDEHIYYMVPVGRYFENSVKVKVNVANAPSSAKILLIPQEVTLSYRMRFENKKEILPSDFQVVVDYRRIGSSHMAKPYIVKKPANIFDVKTDPVFIECIVN